MKFLIIMLSTFWLLTGCVTKEAVEGGKAVDDRPGLSFTVPKNVKASELNVFVDGLMMGTVDKFISPKGTLRILKGTHVVKVTKDGQVVSEQKIFVGDSQTKVISINIQ